MKNKTLPPDSISLLKNNRYGEPWRIVEIDFLSMHERDEVMVMTKDQYDKFKANENNIPDWATGFVGVFKKRIAIRIVNCVNACSGERVLLTAGDIFMYCLASFMLGCGFITIVLLLAKII